jgi:hypothetical protein
MDYATPRQIDDLAQCVFYHSMDLPGIGPVAGAWDLRGRFDEYVGGVDLAGKRVLDVGTASGFLTVEAERRGATVVSFDADSARRYSFLPGAQFRADPEGVIRQADETLEMMKNSYWLAHRAFGLKAQAYYGDLYHLPAPLGPFDVGIIAQILVHQRDPIGALTSVAALCKRLVIVEGMFESADVPLARLLATEGHGSSWWHLSVALYSRVLALLGFSHVAITTTSYRCVGRDSDEEVTTLVVDRPQ